METETAGTPETVNPSTKKQMKREKIKPVKTYNADLSEREKAVILWAIVTDCNDWQKIYLLSRPNDPSTYSEKNIAGAASKWKHSAKVEKYTEQARENWRNKIESFRLAADNAGNSPGQDEGGQDETKPGNGEEKKPKPAKIDFTDTQNALQELNRLANDIADPTKRADAIQAIQKLINQTKTEDETRPDLQRFYTPLSCRGCKLYEEAQKAQ